MSHTREIPLRREKNGGSARDIPESAAIAGEIDLDSLLALALHFKRRSPPSAARRRRGP